MTRKAHTTPEGTAPRVVQPNTMIRWMLWLPHGTLVALGEAAAASGGPKAEIVREATDARLGLSAEQASAYRAASEQRGVPVSEVLRDALIKGTPEIAPS